MKKNLFLLGSFMATSLVASNTLLTIGCKKAAPVKKTENKDNEKDTATVIGETSIKIKSEITNIIDDIITNKDDAAEDWYIELNDENIVNKAITNELDNAVELLNKPEQENKKIALDQALSTHPEFINVVKEKFASLKGMIISKIIQQKEQLGISDFEFNIVSDSIDPMLTNVNGDQVLKAYNKIKKTEFDFYTATGIEHLDLFKIVTDLKYTFKFSNNSFDGTYDEAELLIAGNVFNYKTISKFAYNRITNLLNEDDEKNVIREVNIYNGNFADFEKYDYIGKKMDWDFSKQKVQDEIKSIQFNQLEKSRKSGDKFDGLEYEQENFEFKIDPKNYMKFSNENMNIKRDGEDNILIYNGIDASTGKEVTNQINNGEKAIKNIKEQYEFFANETAITDWNGGKINREFIEQAIKDGTAEVKTDGESKEIKKPKINLSKYYGLGSEDKSSSDILIGYGTTTIRKAEYEGISLPRININTNLTASNFPKLNEIYEALEKYVGSTVDLLHSLIDVFRYDSSDYYFKWVFNDDQWGRIINEVNNPDGDATVSFEWVMQNVLFKDLTTGENALPIDKVPPDSQSFLNSNKEIKYYNPTGSHLVLKSGYVYKTAPLYLKYGPFVVYLAGNDAVTTWSTRSADYIMR